MKLAGFCIVLLVPLSSLTATEPGLGPLLEDAAAAGDFDYCQWAHGGASRDEVLPDFDKILDKDSRTATEEELAAAILVKSGVAVAQASNSLRSCKKEFTRGHKRFAGPLARNLRKFGKGDDGARSEDQEIAGAQAAIRRHWVQDQAARVTYVGLQTEDKSGERFWARQFSAAHATLIDAEATAYMKRLLDAYDWVDIKRFGATVSNHAWLIVQHADDHPEFQALALARMEPHLASGGVRPSNYAFLWDRVAVNTGKPQRYGTQPTWECTDGKLTLQPLEDPEGVNERRAAMDMNSVEEGLAEMARSVCR